VGTVIVEIRSGEGGYGVSQIQATMEKVLPNPEEEEE